jgi:hypothetical protein
MAAQGQDALLLRLTSVVVTMLGGLPLLTRDTRMYAARAVR